MLRTKNYPDNARITHIGLLLRKQYVHRKWSIKVASDPAMLEGAKTDNFSALPMLARGRYVNITKNMEPNNSSVEFSLVDSGSMTEKKLGAFPKLYSWSSKTLRTLESEQMAFSHETIVDGRKVEVVIPQLELARVSVLQFTYLCQAAMTSAGFSLDFDVSYEENDDLLTVNVLNNRAISTSVLKSNAFKTMMAWLLFDTSAMNSFKSIYRNLQLEMQTDKNGWQTWNFRFDLPNVSGWRVKSLGRYSSDKTQFLVEQIVGLEITNKVPSKVIFKGDGIFDTEIEPRDKINENKQGSNVVDTTPVLDSSAIPNDEHVKLFKNENFSLSFSHDIKVETQAKKRRISRAEDLSNESNDARNTNQRAASTDEPSTAGDSRAVSLSASGELGISQKEAANRFKLFQDMLQSLEQVKWLSVSPDRKISELRRVRNSRLHKLKTDHSLRCIQCVQVSMLGTSRTPQKDFLIVEVDVSDGISPLSTLVVHSVDMDDWDDIYISIKKGLVANSLSWPTDLLMSYKRSKKLNYSLVKHPSDLKNDQDSARRWAIAIERKLK